MKITDVKETLKNETGLTISVSRESFETGNYIVFSCRKNQEFDFIYGQKFSKRFQVSYFSNLNKFFIPSNLFEL